MPYTVTVAYTDDKVLVTFAGDCAGIWGRYEGTRTDSNAWLIAGRSAMEARWAMAHGIDGVTHGAISPEAADQRDLDTYRWVCEECPLAALAGMCAEWGPPTR